MKDTETALAKASLLAHLDIWNLMSRLLPDLEGTSVINNTKLEMHSCPDYATAIRDAQAAADACLQAAQLTNDPEQRAAYDHAAEVYNAWATGWSADAELCAALPA